MGAVTNALTALQTALAQPGGATVATVAYTATQAAARTARTAVATGITATETAIAPTLPASWGIFGKTATLSGSIVVGQAYSLWVNGVRFAYAAIAGDTLYTVANQIAAAITIGLGIQAFVSGGAVTVSAAGSVWIGIEPLAGSPPQIAIAIGVIVTQTANLANLTAIQGYVGRLSTNLANAST